ncbi:protein argonaute-3 [Anopheles aquasalis]|uniref:protein argonaute-3 n=1 Tax=Anopheles aquasalis TaxID=42839 RepID=UPI00215A612C|nr:protein argonaute-3 [Anopheles aquasalis]
MSLRAKLVQSIIEAAKAGKSSSSDGEAPAKVAAPTSSGTSGYGTQETTDQASSSAAELPSRTRGRAKLVSSLLGPSHHPPAVVDVDSVPVQKPAIGSRGRLVQAVLSTLSEKSSASVVSVSAPGESTKASATGAAVVEEAAAVAEPSSSKPAMEPVVRTGSSGSKVSLMVNYMELKCAPGRGVFLYTVDFQPNVDSRPARSRCLEQNASILGSTFTFTGDLMMLPVKLPDNVTTCKAKNPNNDEPVTMTIKFRGAQKMSENVNFYNTLFRRIMHFLQLTEMGRKCFDPSQMRVIPQQRLEVWPGYVTAINEYEGGLMLNLDVTHRVLMQTTVYELMQTIAMADKKQFRDNVKKTLLGMVVLTRYNNKTYRIDDILFDENPQSTFDYRGDKISYADYYQRQHGIKIQDLQQPLLLNRTERMVTGSAKPLEMLFCLVPEICFLTGLTDEMRSDFMVMRDIATYTRVTPNQRLAAMQRYCERVISNEKASKLLSDWGLELVTKPKILVGRTLDQEKIQFANGTVNAGPNADFNRNVTDYQMLEVVNIRQWVLVHTSRDGRCAKTFLDYVHRCSRALGIDIAQPKTIVLPSDDLKEYSNLLRTRIPNGTQIVVLICPTSRDDRYAMIKRICCSEVPVPTQVINSRTLMNEKKNRTIVQKIIMQMNCKLGGTLWGVDIPMANTMICGIDAYHHARGADKSVTAFIASLDAVFTHWFSHATLQGAREEMGNGLALSLERSLVAYQRRNCQLPDRIVIFRDGVGDSQLQMCEQYELMQLAAACKLVEPSYSPKITFIVVQKRILTRLFAVDRTTNDVSNPLPGTVMDHSVTRRFLFDYFLVSQNVRQGTVTPSHYIVLRDDCKFRPDILQRLSYKLCYMYYNWPGTVRVPACCQYAHKLAYLIGQSVKRMPDESLNDKLYYL